MREKWNPHEEFNQTSTTLAEFMAYYNNTMPVQFPRATEKALKKFQAEHASSFEEDGSWSVDKHRKRLMDWLASYKETDE